MLDIARSLNILHDPAMLPHYQGVSNVVMAGYSEGGHAALWADQLRAEYAPEVKVAGILGFAPAPDPLKIVRDSVSGSSTVWLPPYILAAYADYYNENLSPDAVLQPAYSDSLTLDTHTYCIDQLEVASGRYGSAAGVSRVYQAPFIQAARANTLDTIFPVLSGLLAQNIAGTQSSQTPALILAGQRDTVVLPDTQTQLQTALCQTSGRSVQLVEYPGVTHYTAMSTGMQTALDWLKQINRGSQPERKCP